MIDNETKTEITAKSEGTETKKPEAPRKEESSYDRPPRRTTDSSDRSSRKTFRGGSSRRPDKRKFFMKRKVCFFCKNKDVVIDYKDFNLMRRFIAESGKITPRRFSGTCAKHQRKLSTEIKKARQMALIPYTDR
jgi:small subunit ribosomal protein S18